MTAAVTDHRRRMVRLVSVETAAKKEFSVISGKSVGAAHYGQTLEVHSTFLLRPLGMRGRKAWTAD